MPTTNPLPRIPLGDLPRNGHIYANETTVPVSVTTTRHGHLHITPRKGGTLGSYLADESALLEKNTYLVDLLVKGKVVTIEQQ